MAYPLLASLALSAVSYAHANPLSSYTIEASPTGISLAPMLVADHPHGTLNDSYIVMFKPDLEAELMQNHLNFLQSAYEEDMMLEELDAGVRHVYDGHVQGYAGTFSENTIFQIRQMPEVDFVERDQIVLTTDVVTQGSAPWGLARISRRSKLTLGIFTKYVHETLGGEGVDVYVIDTGINVNHTELVGRASWGKTIVQDDVDDDSNGHGTHCAGTIASRAFGVAKAANVVAVKVLGSSGSGSMSDVVGGVIYAVEAAQAKADAAAQEVKNTGTTKYKGAVANMSLGGGQSKALNDAVNRAVKLGLHFSVAAGNDNSDACRYSPASALGAITIGASTLGDERASFSNYGPCVDVFAPGLNILSTYVGSPHAMTTMSGTSMASPHTAGLLAYLLSQYPSATFNPVLDPNAEDGGAKSAISMQDAYAFIYDLLPTWSNTFLPPTSNGLIVRAPPQGQSQTNQTQAPQTLTPLQLKKALLALATADALEPLPLGTPNLLIFNNATA